MKLEVRTPPPPPVEKEYIITLSRDEAEQLKKVVGRVQGCYTTPLVLDLWDVLNQLGVGK